MAFAAAQRLFQRLRRLAQRHRFDHSGRALDGMRLALRQLGVAGGQRLADAHGRMPVVLAEACQHAREQGGVAHQAGDAVRAVDGGKGGGGRRLLVRGRAHLVVNDQVLLTAAPPTVPLKLTS
jgi:hypothetical protein